MEKARQPGKLKAGTRTEQEHAGTRGETFGWRSPALAKKLPRGEQLRLARRLLGPETATGDDLLAQGRVGIGRYAGQGWIAEDFDAPLPPETQKYFDGEDNAL